MLVRRAVEEAIERAKRGGSDSPPVSLPTPERSAGPEPERATKGRYGLNVNGTEYPSVAEPHRSLLDVIRDELRLTGTKKGCDEGECGACTVTIDSAPVLSCMVLAADARGRNIVTIEGLSAGGQPHPLQVQMRNLGGIQCGYCTPGIIMTGHALLQENPTPTAEQVRAAIAGNICRCTGYAKIVESIQAAGAEIVST